MKSFLALRAGLGALVLSRGPHWPSGAFAGNPWGPQGPILFPFWLKDVQRHQWPCEALFRDLTGNGDPTMMQCLDSIMTKWLVGLDIGRMAFLYGRGR